MSSDSPHTPAVQRGPGAWLAAPDRSSPLWLAGVPVLLLIFRTLLEPGSVLSVGDLAFFHLPLRTLLMEAASHGIPWWNGALNGGQPILSNPNYAAFYPLTWLAAAAGAALSIRLLLLLHAGWAYAGAWRLARSLGCRPAPALLAALGFAAGGSFVSSATLLTLYCGLAWTPWILLWAGRALAPANPAWRRDATLAGLGIAAQLLAGEPVNCVLSGIALVGLAVDSWAGGARTVRRLLPTLAVAVLLGGAQLVPTLGRLAASPRGGGIAGDEATVRSMPPARLLEWAVPHPLGDPMRIDEELFFGQSVHDKGFPYLISIYPGLLIAVLALGSIGRPGLRWRWTWVVMIGGGLFLALGRHNPLFAPLVGWLPVFDQLRYPEKSLLLANAALPFAAALGWQRRESARRARGSGDAGHRAGADLAVLLCAIVVAGLAAMCLLLMLRPEAALWLAATLRSTPVPPPAEATFIRWMRTETLCSLATGLLTIGLLIRLGRPSVDADSGVRPSTRAVRPRTLELAVLMLLAVDLARAGWNLLPVVPFEAVARPPATLAAALDARAGGPYENRLVTDLMYSRDAGIPLRYDGAEPLSFRNGVETIEPYIATLWGWSYALNVDYDLMLTEPARLALATFSEVWSTPSLARRFAGAWSVGTVALHRDVGEVLRDRFEGRPAPRMRIETNAESLPEIRSVPRVRFHADQETALAAARAGGFRFAQGAEWVAAAGSDSEVRVPSASTVEIAVLDAGWGHTRFATSSESPGFVQIARTWDGGWSATIDGRETAIHRTAAGQMGLRVPAGGHEVELVYFDPLVPSGVLLSLLGVGALVWSWRRRAP